MGALRQYLYETGFRIQTQFEEYDRWKSVSVKQNDTFRPCKLQSDQKRKKEKGLNMLNSGWLNNI